VLPSSVTVQDEGGGDIPVYVLVSISFRGERVTTTTDAMSTLQSLVLPASSWVISSVLYKLTSTSLGEQLGTLPSAPLPIHRLFLCRVTEWIILLQGKTSNPYESAAAATAALVPYYYILHVYYVVPLSALVASVAIDTVATLVPLVMHEGWTMAMFEQQERDAAITVTQTMLVSTAFAVMAHSLSTVGGAFMVQHFDGVQSVLAPSIPMLALAFLPFAFLVQDVSRTAAWKMLALLALQGIVWARLSDVSGSATIILGAMAMVAAARMLQRFIHRA